MIGAGFEAGIGLIPGVELIFAFVAKVQGDCEHANGYLMYVLLCSRVNFLVHRSVFGLSRALASASSFPAGLNETSLITPKSH
jgi:hypothetical protein